MRNACRFPFPSYRRLNETGDMFRMVFVKKKKEEKESMFQVPSSSMLLYIHLLHKIHKKTHLRL